MSSPSIASPTAAISEGCSTSSVQLVNALSSSLPAVVAIVRWKQASASRKPSEDGACPSASSIAAASFRAVSGVAFVAASPASGTSRCIRASTSWRSETLLVESSSAIESLRLRLIPSFGVLATKMPPPAPRVERTSCELESSRSASRSVGRLTPNSAASSASVPSRSPGRRFCRTR